MEQDQSNSLFGMQANSIMQSKLNTISGWAKFISITGIVLVLLAAVFFAAVGDKFFAKFTELMGYNMNITGVLVGIGVFFIAVMIVWFYLLLRASSLIRQGIKSQNQDQLAEGFRMLRIYFVLSSIFTVCSFLTSIVSKINL